MSIHPNTSNDTTNNNLLQSNKWTIVKDYNFRENPSARQNLINDVQFDLNDYNNGNVKYVNKPELLSIKNGKLNMEVGNILSQGCVKQGTNQCIESLKLVFNEKLLPNKLIAFRAEQIPFENGAWPAFWLAPASGTWGVTAGEIDLFENVNGDIKGVSSTMHTPPVCYMQASVAGKSTQSQTNCNDGNPLPYIGCGVTHQDARSSKSGTFVVDWTASLETQEGYIKTYWWPYDDQSVYQSGGVFSDNPDTEKWQNQLYGNFKMGPQCTIDHYSTMSLVLNTQVCGEWAGGVYQPGGQWGCQNAVKNMNKDKLKWVIDNIRILRNGPDVQVPLYKQKSTPKPNPNICTNVGQDAYGLQPGLCTPPCGGLKLFVQKKDESNRWMVTSYSSKTACTNDAYNYYPCVDFNDKC